MIRGLFERFGIELPSFGLGEVPARIMVPRIVFLGTSLALLLFGMLMIYSASSILALTSEECQHNPAFYLIRQAGFAAVGIVIAVVLVWIIAFGVVGLFVVCAPQSCCFCSSWS